MTLSALADEEFCLEVQCGVYQCILGSKQSLVGGDIARRLTSIVSRPLNLDGWGLAHAIFNPVLSLSRLVELNTLGIPAISCIIDHCQQLSHGGTALSYNITCSFVVQTC